MKKTLNNAMMKKFETMVAGTEEQTEASAVQPEKAAEKPTVVETPPAPVPEPVPVVQPSPVPVSVPVAPQVQASPVTPVPVSEPVTSVSSAIQAQEQSSVSKDRKVIPLTPDEKSSGVLHIRLGELRSYVDFITQFNKTSYQQYISSLIEKDYEKNKDTYLKYKEFMEQFHM